MKKVSSTGGVKCASRTRRSCRRQGGANDKGGANKKFKLLESVIERIKKQKNLFKYQASKRSLASGEQGILQHWEVHQVDQQQWQADSLPNLRFWAAKMQHNTLHPQPVKYCC